MKINLLIIVAVITCFPVTSLFAQSVTIQYGTVEHVQTVSKDAKHAGGALAGGVIGALVGPRRHRGIRSWLVPASALQYRGLQPVAHSNNTL